MTLEEIFRNAMVIDTNTAAIFGPRWYLVQMPQNPTYPLAMFQRISTTRMYAQAPDAGQQATTGWARFQVTMVADGPNGGAQVLAGRDALLAACQTFNASYQPSSPAMPLYQTPNFFLQERMSNIPDTQQPLFTYMVDIRLFFGQGA